MEPLTLLAIGAVLLTLFKKTVKLNLPPKGKNVLYLISKYSTSQKIPPDVLATWMMLESNYNPNEYNPERTAIERWAEDIVETNPTKWKKNPDFAKAKSVLARIRAGESTSNLTYQDWPFGSYGLMQTARLSASYHAGYPFSSSNSALFDPELNVDIGTKEIAYIRKKLYGSKTTLSDPEWSSVRVGYVAGSNASQTSDLAKVIKAKFLKALAEIRGGAPVA